MAKTRKWTGLADLRLVKVLGCILAGAFGLGLVAAVPVLAQDFKWPWDAQTQRAPVPREPVYRDPPRQAAPPVYREGGGGYQDGAGGYQDGGGGYQDGGASPWAATRSPVCLELERRLVQAGQSGNASRQKLPAIREEMRKLEGQLHGAQSKLDNGGCYEYFLFTKTLRRTKGCIRLSRSVDTARRRLGELEAERHRISGSNRQSRQDEIVRELSRNNCGNAYTQEARRRDSSPFSGLWQDQDSGAGGGYGNSYRRLPFATYRTVCVRLCDGYYFPVSFSTLPNHFERDAAQCQSKCVAPSALYYHQNPGAGVNEMVAFATNQPYTELKSAFKYRKEYVQGCSCKQAEFVPQSTGTLKQGSIEQPSVGTPHTAQAPRPFDPTR